MSREMELRHDDVVKKLRRSFGVAAVAKGDRLPSDGPAQATILLVEDEVLVRMSLADQLRRAGYVVFEASSAEEALDLLQGNSVQLVLSDIRMRGSMDGAGLARAILAHYPQVKIVLASGQSFSAKNWGDSDGCFPKPYDPNRLMQHIKRLGG